MARKSWGVEVVGEKILERKLKKLGEKISTAIMRTAVKRGGAVIQQRAVAKAPQKTGNLKREIRTVVTKASPLFAEAKVSWRRGKASRTPAFYGLFAEKGTRERKHDSGKSVGAMRPTPFLIPAFDEGKDQAQRVMADILRTEIKRRASG